MLSSLLAVLSAAALAVAAATAYTPPAALLAAVQDGTSGCVLPASYHVLNFVAKTNDTATTLSEYSFGYLETATNTSTACHYDSSSKSTTPTGLVPRFPCQDRDVKFIWAGERKVIFLVQRVCPDSNG